MASSLFINSLFKLSSNLVIVPNRYEIFIYCTFYDKNY